MSTIYWRLRFPKAGKTAAPNRERSLEVQSLELQWWSRDNETGGVPRGGASLGGVPRGAVVV